MTTKHKIIAFCYSTLLAIVAFCFFRFVYPYHIHFQETMQLFEFSWGYLWSVVGIPGGAADYIARFLTQFFYYAVGGAVVIAVLLASLHLLVYKAVGTYDLAHFALSAIPPLCLWVFLCDENALLVPIVAMIIALGMGIGVRGMKDSALKSIVLAVLTPVAYFLCGSLAIVFVIAATRGDKLWKMGMALVILAACPFVFRLLCQYPLDRLVTGIHYHRFHNVLPFWMWMAAAVIVLEILTWKITLSRRDCALGVILMVLTGGGAAFAIVKAADMEKEEVLEYDFMLSHRMWNRIMMKADRKSPQHPISVAVLNIALATEGRMNGHMFDYYQNGPQGLTPSFQKEPLSAMSSAEIYYQIGMVNTAQRFAFEGKELIPDFQKSARCYQILVRTNIINVDYEVAGKYIDALKRTMFYSSWAKQQEALLYKENAIEAVNEYSWLRYARFTSRDFLYSADEMESMLGLLYLETNKNHVAYDYLVAHSLLSKDLERFKQFAAMGSFREMPKSYQEAFILDWLIGGAQGGIPPFVEKRYADRFRSFVEDMNSKLSEDEMFAKYPDTYWFYYFYRYN